MPKVLRVATLTFLLFTATRVNALVKFDFELPYFIEWGPEVKDHSIVRVGGVYHIFYLRGNPARTIGHATSPDLVRWTLQPQLLYVVPGTWDERAMWAPQVIPHPIVPGQYIMYYTGVNYPNSQQAGVAVSNDLYTWSKIPWPVYHPDPAWAQWSATAFCHGRDPFVLEDAGTWYMLNTAKTKTNKGAISLASSSDLFNWTDIGPFYTHANWHVLESVQLVRKDTKFHLFFTEETVIGTSHMSSDALFSGWDANNIVHIDLGGAPEVNEFDPGDWTFSRHTVHNPPPGAGTLQYTIKIDKLSWFEPEGAIPYVAPTWPLEDQWELVWGNAFQSAPTFVNNPQFRGVTVDIGYVGNFWLSSFERYQGPLNIGGPGIYQGEIATGLIRSQSFTIEGNSMNLLVGGSNLPDDCYVALVDAGDQTIIYKETGGNTDAMDRRYWNLRPHIGKMAYIEVLDNSTVGHIGCDDITESWAVVSGGGGPGGDDDDRRKRNHDEVSGRNDGGRPELHQNVPNPFNPVTTISYEVPAAGRVTIDVFDVSGRLIRRLMDSRIGPGTHSVEWNGANEVGVDVPSGVYFYRMAFEGRTIETRKMMLLK